VLPNDVLLEIFELCVCRAEAWETLVHVCRRWRYITFAASSRLELRLVCTTGTPAREMLDIWPKLPIVIRVSGGIGNEIGDVIAALKHHDRVCEIHVDTYASDYKLRPLVEAMQDTFPALTALHLNLGLMPRAEPFVPDSLLGGTAPCLRSLFLRNFASSELPKLLLSASSLVDISLLHIPYSRATSPETMFGCLSSMTKLEQLRIGFQRDSKYIPRSTSHRPSRSPLTCTVLPMLTSFSFEGESEYLDHLFSLIDAPLLDRLDYVNIEYTNTPVLDITQIPLFIGWTEPFRELDRAHMRFIYDYVDVILSSREGTTAHNMVTFSIAHDFKGWRLSSLTRGPPITFFERFDISSSGYLPLLADDMGNTPWLELLRIFTAVEDLYLSNGLALCVTRALRELTGEGLAGVLPALRNLSISRLEPSGPVREAIGKFAAARELSGRPIVVQHWGMKGDSTSNCARRSIIDN